MKIKFLNLGRQPLANSFLSSNSKKILDNEFFYNLSVSFDTKTYLVSLTKPVNPILQYTDKYAHRASESKTMREAYSKIAKKIQNRFKPMVIMEIGSNDGVFIKNFDKNKVIAVEPCKNLAKITQKKFRTYAEFWNFKLAKKIFKKFKKAEVIYSANTISHIPNLKETFDAIEFSLSEKGVLIIEDPSLLSVIKNTSYDQFYDEHVYVFSAISISNILRESNLRLFDIEKTSTHGGSLRYFICKKNAKYKTSNYLKKIIKDEIKKKLHKLSTYKKFSKKVIKSKNDLIKLIKKLKKNKKKIISYGATYKSTTVFNYCNIGPELIEYVTDTTINKQGKFTPGKHIPIFSPEIGMNDQVDYAFLGAWNFKKEILSKENFFLQRGGRFITHVPSVKIIKN